MADDKFLTGPELASRWKLSHQTLANWRHAGKGPPFIRVGARVLYPLEGINAFERISSSWLSKDNSPATSDAIQNSAP
jgi:hypothetical protein